MITSRLFSTLLAALLTLVGFVSSAAADPATTTATRNDIQKTFGFVPGFLQKVPESMLPGAWEELKGFQLNPATTLDGRTKELIGLAVAAQVPCRYCVVAHTEFAKLNGAGEAEIGEAVGMAALTRQFSTWLNGIQMDETRFRSEITKLIANAKQAAMAKRGAPAPINVVDGASALAEVNSLFGFTPEFIAKFPETARAGAWRQMRDLQLSPKTALSGKTKELIGLAVAAQVPCRYCVVAHTEFAKLNGATDLEIREAVAMASLTRNFSTLLNGLQVDEGQFRRDVDRLVRGAKAAAAKRASKARD
jgi:AhpD family alkylhydroperoxidase